MVVFANPRGNELIPLTNDEYPFEEHLEDVLTRQTHRSGMLLNVEELVGFVHLPSREVASPKLCRQTRKSKAAPAIALNRQGLVLGENVHAALSKTVALTAEQRVRHIHVIGASGTGKSTFLLNLIRQDIEAGEGVGVLDPHGDLVDRILEIVPEHRLEDVILLDPADEEYSIGFNILSAHSDLEKRLLASDLVSVFQRLSTSWGDQMASVLQNAILAFLESDQGGTLADLRRFLLEPKYRNEFLATVCDPEIVYYWQHAFTQLSGNKSIGPVLTRLETFLSPKPIRYMVSQKENRLDFGAILDTGKIFLAKLAQGLIGRENSYLLGTLLVAKLQQLAMSRQRQTAAARRDFWLYIDEFHNFITPSMAEILTGARKYRLGLILAHQELRQLQRDSEVASAVLSNPYTRICFRVGDDDAKKLEGGFSFFEGKDLQNLGTGEAICRVERCNFDFNITVPMPEVPDEAEAVERRERAIEASRKKCGTPRAGIEAELRKSSEVKGDMVEAEREHREVRRDVPQGRPAKPEPKRTPELREEGPEQEVTPPHRAEVSEPAAPFETAESDEQSSQHQAIKERIAAEAESLDYAATLEQPVLGNQGRADVALERGTRKIACEISVTTTIDHEVQNVRKCLAAGFGHVAVICLNKRRLGNIECAVAATLTTDQAKRVGYYLPNEFISRLYDWAGEEPAVRAGAPSKPRKQGINLFAGSLSDDERKRREQDMLKNLADAMRRTKH